MWLAASGRSGRAFQPATKSLRASARLSAKPFQPSSFTLLAYSSPRASQASSTWRQPERKSRTQGSTHSVRSTAPTIAARFRSKSETPPSVRKRWATRTRSSSGLKLPSPSDSRKKRSSTGSSAWRRPIPSFRRSRSSRRAVAHHAGRSPGIARLLDAGVRALEQVGGLPRLATSRRTHPAARRRTTGSSQPDATSVRARPCMSADSSGGIPTNGSALRRTNSSVFASHFASWRPARR